MDVTQAFLNFCNGRSGERKTVPIPSPPTVEERNPFSFFSDLVEGPTLEKQLSILQKLHSTSLKLVRISFSSICRREHGICICDIDVDLESDIESLRLVDAFLRQNWIPYLKYDSDLGESDRERIETEVKANLSEIKANIQEFEEEFGEVALRNSHVNEHAKAAIQIVTSHYKLVDASFRRMKQLRIQNHANELAHEYYHLVPKRTWSNRFRRGGGSASPKLDRVEEEEPLSSNGSDGEELLSTANLRRRGDASKVFVDLDRVLPAASRPSSYHFDGDDSTKSSFEASLGEEERQELLNENEALRSQLNSLDDQLREVESQLHSIGDATSFMAATVEQQAEQLSHIFDLTGEALGSISRGTKNLNIAKATTSDLRLFTLVLLIFLSFSLLFLHYFY